MTVRTSRWLAPASPPPAGPPPAGPPAGGPLLACHRAAQGDELAAHFRVRHQVFVVEQGLFVAADAAHAGPAGRLAGDDRDAHDDDPATIHVVGLADGVLCGTVRLYPMGEPGRWKGDRLAVLAGHRRHGLGAPLVRFAVATAGALGGREMEAYIQPANVAFFEWLGWRRTGGIVDYAGRGHQRMVIALDAGAWPVPGSAVPG